MYKDQPLSYFLDKLCSKSPEPGGGSAAALVGAVAAGLAGMLAALTIDKKGYEDQWENMKRYYEKEKNLKEEMLELLQKDTEAFDDAAKAFKLPKNTEEEKKKRALAIEEGLKKATEVPLSIMEKSLEISKLAIEILEKGNEMAITDGAISTIFANAAAVGAMFNVRINFSWMKDKDYISNTEKKLSQIIEETERIKEKAMEYTLNKLKK